ncbi:MAG: HEPN domain-containing protein [Solirubrobacterales bacterium]
MSPRSAEFLAEARKRLRTARAALGVRDPAGAVSAAYYAMLYAVRAALSEEDRYAKTHAGTWGEFRAIRRRHPRAARGGELSRSYTL